MDRCEVGKVERRTGREVHRKREWRRRWVETLPYMAIYVNLE